MALNVVALRVVCLWWSFASLCVLMAVEGRGWSQWYGQLGCRHFVLLLYITYVRWQVLYPCLANFLGMGQSKVELTAALEIGKGFICLLMEL